MLMCSLSANLRQISLKNSFEIVVFQTFAEIEMKTWLFGRHFEMVQYLI